MFKILNEPSTNTLPRNKEFPEQSKDTFPLAPIDT